MTQLGVNGKWYFTSAPLRFFATAGVGVYNFDPGSTRFGGAVGAGRSTSSRRTGGWKAATRCTAWRTTRRRRRTRPCCCPYATRSERSPRMSILPPRQHAAQRAAAQCRRRSAARATAPGARAGRCGVVATRATAARLAVRAQAGGRWPARPAAAQRRRRLRARRVGRVARARDSARRPWLHGDAGGPMPCCFADEAELIACLLARLGAGRGGATLVVAAACSETWTCGLAAPAGAGRVATGGAGARLLAERGDAVACVARLDSADAERACAPCSRAYGCCTSSADASRSFREPTTKQCPHRPLRRGGRCRPRNGVTGAASARVAGARAERFGADTGAAPPARAGAGADACTRLGAHAGLCGRGGAGCGRAAGRRPQRSDIRTAWPSP